MQFKRYYNDESVKLFNERFNDLDCETILGIIADDCNDQDQSLFWIFDTKAPSSAEFKIMLSKLENTHPEFVSFAKEILDLELYLAERWNQQDFCSPLHQFVFDLSARDVEVVASLQDYTDSYGYNLLHWLAVCAKKTNITFASQHLALSQMINQKNIANLNPMENAIASYRPEYKDAFETIYKLYPQTQYTVDMALSAVITFGSVELFEYLIGDAPNANIILDIRSFNANFPQLLSIALDYAQQGKIHFEDINAQDKSGYTILHKLVVHDKKFDWHGNLHVQNDLDAVVTLCIHKLHDAGANFAIKSNTGKNVITLAYEYDSFFLGEINKYDEFKDDLL